ncbi:hypothetical protein J6590_036827, partial [Homalodisca vitripennis]
GEKVLRGARAAGYEGCQIVMLQKGKDVTAVNRRGTVVTMQTVIEMWHIET